MKVSNIFSHAHVSRPENIRYYVYVVSHTKTSNGGDLYEELGKFEHENNEEFVLSLIPQFSKWFQNKYKGNKDAYLSIEKIGEDGLFLGDLEEEHLGCLHKENIE